MKRDFARELLCALLLLALGTVAWFEGNPATAQTDVPRGNTIYVAPNGIASNSGSMSSPIDIVSALRKDRVRPGSTVLLRGGTYVGPYRSDLTGTPNAPITVRSAPGETALITCNLARADGGILNVNGAWTTYRNFEISNESIDRGHGQQFRPMGLNVQAPHTKFINLVIHNAGHGIGFWKEAEDSEIYGNILFNGGSQNTATDMRHGHAIYTQNSAGEKLIRDNVIFDEFGWGIHIYPSPGGVNGYRVEGNVCFNNGLPTDPQRHYNNILASGYKPYKTDNIVVRNNYSYYSLSQENRGRFSDANLCLGCADREKNGTATVTDNYFVGGQPVLFAQGWQTLNVSGNVLVGANALVRINSVENSSVRSYSWDRNHYFAQTESAAFAVDDKSTNFSEWVRSTGFDRSSSMGQRPSGTDVFVRPNEYENGRAHVVVYNWDRKPAVEVDLSSALRPGAAYQIYNVQNLTGTPVLQGTYDGRPVRLPMTPARVTVPVGVASNVTSASLATGPDFNVFLVKPSSNAPPQSTYMTSSVERTRALQNSQGAASSGIPSAFLPFVGRYEGANGSVSAEITADSRSMAIRILNERDTPSYPITQVSGTRFRMEGTPPGFYVNFRVQGNRVLGINLLRGLAPMVAMDKK